MTALPFDLDVAIAGEISWDPGPPGVATRFFETPDLVCDLLAQAIPRTHNVRKEVLLELMLDRFSAEQLSLGRQVIVLKPKVGSVTVRFAPAVAELLETPATMPPSPAQSIELVRRTSGAPRRVRVEPGTEGLDVGLREALQLLGARPNVWPFLESALELAVTTDPTAQVHKCRLGMGRFTRLDLIVDRRVA